MSSTVPSRSLPIPPSVSGNEEYKKLIAAYNKKETDTIVEILKANTELVNDTNVFMNREVLGNKYVKLSIAQLAKLEKNEVVHTALKTNGLIKQVDWVQLKIPQPAPKDPLRGSSSTVAAKQKSLGNIQFSSPQNASEMQRKRKEEERKRIQKQHEEEEKQRIQKQQEQMQQVAATSLEPKPVATSSTNTPVATANTSELVEAAQRVAWDLFNTLLALGTLKGLSYFQLESLIKERLPEYLSSQLLPSALETEILHPIFLTTVVASVGMLFMNQVATRGFPPPITSLTNRISGVLPFLLQPSKLCLQIAVAKAILHVPSIGVSYLYSRFRPQGTDVNDSPPPLAPPPAPPKNPPPPDFLKPKPKN